jgi:hypothetical protein
MSFSVGVYDLFAYTIPGFFYLFVGNEILKSFGFSPLNYQAISNPTTIALLIFAAFVLGHVMDFVADKWKSFLEKEKVSTLAVDTLKRNFPDLNIKFQPNERSILFAVIRRNHDDITATIDRNKAISILFQNVSLGFLLYTIFLVVQLLINGYTLNNLVISIAAIIMSIATRQQGRMFNLWFNSLIFEVALTYGTSTKEILKNTQSQKKAQNKSTGAV